MAHIFWLFPIIFMLHEMEEIIGFGRWLDKNKELMQKYRILARMYRQFSNEGFAVAVLEEYLLCIVITCVSVLFHTHIIWLGTFIAFTLHLIVHILQSFVIKQYIPAVVSSILLLPVSILLILKTIFYFNDSLLVIVISSVFCTGLMLLNLAFVHWLMRKVTEKLNKNP